MNNKPLMILACEAGRPFAEEVFKVLKKTDDNVHMVNSKETHFANDEPKTSILESIPGVDLYVFQDVANSQCPNPERPYSTNDNYEVLKTALDAARQARVGRMTPIIPVYAYARQDKAFGREGISAARAAREIEDISPKIETVVTLDIHNHAIAGFFRRANLESLHSYRQIKQGILDLDYLERDDEGKLANILISSADANGANRARKFCEMFYSEMGIISKHADYSRAREQDTTAIDDVRFLGNCKKRILLLLMI